MLSFRSSPHTTNTATAISYTSSVPGRPSLAWWAIRLQFYHASPPRKTWNAFRNFFFSAFSSTYLHWCHILYLFFCWENERSTALEVINNDLVWTLTLTLNIIVDIQLQAVPRVLLLGVRERGGRHAARVPGLRLATASLPAAAWLLMTSPQPHSRKNIN